MSKTRARSRLDCFRALFWRPLRIAIGGSRRPIGLFTAARCSAHERELDGGPEAGIIMRECFGMGPQYRPTGGKDCNKPKFVHTSISGFWLEFPSAAGPDFSGSPTPT